MRIGESSDLQSFCLSLIASAMELKIPTNLWELGPVRSWILASVLCSRRVKNVTIKIALIYIIKNLNSI